MRAFTLAVAFCSFASIFANDVDAAAPKNKLSPHLRRYDFNQDGKINTMERANARMMKAQQREWKAIRRNDAIVR